MSPDVAADVGRATETELLRRLPRWRVLGAGAVFLASGASLVVYVLTGAPLPAVLMTTFLFGGIAAAAAVAPPAWRAVWAHRVRAGVVAGVIGTLAYDASRWALVQAGAFSMSPFKALPFFGEALLVGGASELSRDAAGVAFHVLNGVCFGIAYTIWFGRRGWPAGIAFALGLEACMLAIYPGWLDIRSLREFTQLSLLGHVGYGVALGASARFLLARWSP